MEKQTEKKCDRCHQKDAKVYLATVDGNGGTFRNKYCYECALIEKDKTIQIVNEFNERVLSVLDRVDKSSNEKAFTKELSCLDMVQSIMEKSYLNTKNNSQNSISKPSEFNKLNANLKDAISKEDYESAAEIRDKIQSLSKSS